MLYTKGVLAPTTKLLMLDFAPPSIFVFSIIRNQTWRLIPTSPFSCYLILTYGLIQIYVIILSRELDEGELFDRD